MRTSKRKLKAMIREEKAAARDYRKRGYPKIARQESSHARILERKLKKTKR